MPPTYDLFFIKQGWKGLCRKEWDVLHWNICKDSWQHQSAIWGTELNWYVSCWTTKLIDICRVDQSYIYLTWAFFHRKLQRGCHDLLRRDNFKTWSKSCYCRLCCNQGKVCVCIFVRWCLTFLALLMLISCRICWIRFITKPRRHVSLPWWARLTCKIRVINYIYICMPIWASYQNETCYLKLA